MATGAQNGQPSERRTLRQAEFAGFAFTEGVHSPGTSLPWHWHDTPTICYVLDGAFTEASGGAHVICTPSTLKFMPAGERHSDRFDRGAAHGLLIEVDPDRLQILHPYSSVLEQRVHYHGGPAAAIARRLHEELWRMDAATPLAIEGLMLELLAAAVRLQMRVVDRPAPRWLDQARSLIEEELSGHLGVTGVAAAVGVHPVTLARSFRRAYGSTMGEYVRRRRLERAMEQLRDSQESLATIALANGFADQSHFSNLFRRHTGVTPSAFRRAMQPAWRRRPSPPRGPTAPRADP